MSSEHDAEHDAELELGGVEEPLLLLNALWFRHIGNSLQNSSRRVQYPVPRGLLLKGPAGAGKKALLTALCRRHGVPLRVLEAGELSGSGAAGVAEARLKGAFEELSRGEQKGGYAVLLLEDVEQVCPNLQSATDVAESPLFSASNALLVAATTSHAQHVDARLRRPGRLDREIAFLPPDAAARLQILKRHSARLPIEERERLLPELAGACVGFLGSDLARLCRDVATACIAEGAAAVTREMMDRALAEASQRSALFSRAAVGAFDYPNTSWDRIAGHAQTKAELQAAIVLPQQLPQLFRRFQLPSRAGILLHGPPGTGKTMLARACAAESKVAFLAATSASVYSPYVGGAEAAVREYFAAARNASPCVLFFDEIESIVGKRGGQGGGDGTGVQDRVLATMLNELDGIEESPGVIILAATNRIDMIDPALLRPGRFDKCLFVGPPDADGLRQLWDLYASRRMPLHPDVDLALLIDRSGALSGAHVENICREAALLALRENIHSPHVALRHFLAAIEMAHSRLH